MIAERSLSQGRRRASMTLGEFWADLIELGSPRWRLSSPLALYYVFNTLFQAGIAIDRPIGDALKPDT
jgi:hypothetical protein